MKLNDQQRKAVAYQESICIEACPGSGKTRTIVAKLVECIESIRDTARRIACITYTHAAVYEIEMRLREDGALGDEEYCEIGTIHSFCLTNILQPFHYMLPELRLGFRVIAPESDEWQALVFDLAERHGGDTRRLEGFSIVHRKPDGTTFVPSEITDVAAKELIVYLDRNALVSFNDIVYHSCRIVQRFPFVARGLACRFAWILVDEFQDTSDGQVAILSAIANQKRTRFFLVGDPNQSIMAFAGAHNGLMQSFSKEIGARTDIRLYGNYRCSQRIIEHAEKLIPTVPRMKAVGRWKNFHVDPEYIHVSDQYTAIVDHFLPALEQLGIPLGEAAVLAPWWLPLYLVARSLREAGVPVMGPGARPYHRTRLFASFAEHLCAYVEDSHPDLFRSSLRALFVLLLNITGMPEWRVFSYDGRRCLCRISNLAREMSEEHGREAVKWLRNVATGISTLLATDEFLPTTCCGVISESAEDMIRDIERNRTNIGDLKVSDLGLFAQPRNCLHLITMHGAKGREFDAIAITDLHRGRVPHFSCQTKDEYDEARRQLYVAMTRPRKLLMYFTDSSHPRNRPSPFLGEIGVIECD